MRIPEISVPHYKTKLPSNNLEVSYRPYLVKEEKVLLMALQAAAESDLRQNEVTDAVRHLIKSCIVLPEDLDIDKLPSFDLEWLFLKIRSKSVGEVVEPRLRIPAGECGGTDPDNLVNGCTIDIKVDLDKLEIARSKEHDNKVMLNDNVGIVLTYPTGEMATRLTGDTNDPNAVQEVLWVIAQCVESVFDKDNVYTEKTYDNEVEWRKDVANLIDNLTRENMEKVKKFFATMPKIRYHVKVTCPRCDRQIERDIEGMLDFFS